MLKPITIKGVDPTDKEFLDNLAVKHNTTLSGAFTLLVNAMKSPVINVESEQKFKDLADAIERLTQQLQAVTDERDNALLTIQTVTDEKTQVTETHTANAERIAELETEVSQLQEANEKAQLKGSQFICVLSDESAKAARKIRPFAKKDGFVTANVTDDDFPNQLVNSAVEQFLKRNYSHILNP